MGCWRICFQVIISNVLWFTATSWLCIADRLTAFMVCIAHSRYIFSLSPIGCPLFLFPISCLLFSLFPIDCSFFCFLLASYYFPCFLLTVHFLFPVGFLLFSLFPIFFLLFSLFPTGWLLAIHIRDQQKVNLECTQLQYLPSTFTIEEENSNGLGIKLLMFRFTVEAAESR